jgi:DNA-binding PadR family transcriptional regulator
MEDEIIEDLTLLLLHLTSWEERIHEDLTIHRAWKGFRFPALDALEEAGYLNPSRGRKSVTLTQAGIKHARGLAARYLGEAAQGL